MMKDLTVPATVPEEDIDENQDLHQQILDAYEISLAFTEIQQMAPIPKTFTLLSWCRQVLPRLKTARDIRESEPEMFGYFQSIVAMCELLISRLTLQEAQRAADENQSKVTRQEKEEWMAACQQSKESLAPMKQQVADALDAQKQKQEREKKLNELRLAEEHNRELCCERVRKITRKQFAVASQEEVNIDLYDAE